MDCTADARQRHAGRGGAAGVAGLREGAGLGTGQGRSCLGGHHVPAVRQQAELRAGGAPLHRAGAVRLHRIPALAGAAGAGAGLPCHLPFLLAHAGVGGAHAAGAVLLHLRALASGGPGGQGARWPGTSAHPSVPHRRRDCGSAGAGLGEGGREPHLGCAAGAGAHGGAGHRGDGRGRARDRRGAAQGSGGG